MDLISVPDYGEERRVIKFPLVCPIYRCCSLSRLLSREILVFFSPSLPFSRTRWMDETLKLKSYGLEDHVIIISRFVNSICLTRFIHLSLNLIVNFTKKFILSSFLLLYSIRISMTDTPISILLFMIHPRPTYP